VKALVYEEYTFEQAAEAHTKMLKGKGLVWQNFDETRLEKLRIFRHT